MWARAVIRWLDQGDAGVAAMLTEAAKSPTVIDEAWETDYARQLGVPWPVAGVSREIADGIVNSAATEEVRLLSDTLGRHHGFELWRHLAQRARGLGPQVARALIDRYQERKPAAANWQQVGQRLLANRRLLQEVVEAGGEVSETEKLKVLKEMLPKTTLDFVEDEEFAGRLTGYH